MNDLPVSATAPGTGPNTGVALRIALFTLVSLLAVGTVASTASADEVLGTAPFLAATLALYLLPLFVPGQRDVFAPAAFTGLREASRLLPSLVTLLVYSDSGLGPFLYLSTTERIALVRAVCLLLSVAQLGYLLGYYTSPGARLARVLPNWAGRPWKASYFSLALLLLTVVFLISYAQFQGRAGGSLLDLTRLAEGKEVWRDDATLSWMLRGVELGFLPVILLGTVACASGSRRGLLLTGLCYLVVALLVTRLGQRGPAIVGLLMLLMLFHYLRRRIPLGVYVAVFLVVVAGSTLLGEYRAGVTPGEPLVERVISPSDTLARYSEERQYMAAYAAVMHFFPERHEYLMGESWVGVAVALVPRWLWPEKVDFSPWRDTRIVYNLIQIPAPTTYPALLYANFSWLGVFFGMGLLGLFHRALQVWRSSHDGDATTTLLYVLLLTTFTPTLLGISLMLQYLVPAVLLLAVMTTSRQPAIRLPAG